jgi:hypothetical protein
MKTRILPIVLIMASGCTILRPAAPAPTPVANNTTAPAAAPRAKTYASVIPRTAETHAGLFKVHRVGTKLLFEIPISELDKEMLLVSRIAEAQVNQGYGGQQTSQYLVRWVKDQNKILLRAISTQISADSTSAIYQTVRASNFEAILAAFEIEVWNPDSSAVVIDATSLYTTDVAELSPRRRYQGRRIDPSRSYIDRARSFPENVEIRSVITVERESLPATISVLMNHSMIRLPETPMRPRLLDERVGYFSVGTVDYSTDAHFAEGKRFITRWRLDKKDPGADLSDPVKPITFHVDAGTPEWLVPYVIQGIEDWQPAFEQAGFSNAIIGKRAPTPDEDPAFSPEDIRYPMVRWVPSTIQNAMGPHNNDPRTGEIISSSILMYHNVMNLLRNWYFIQASPADLTARKLPLPDSLMGELVRYVVAHEVGHTLGLPHNMKSSASVPVDSLRSPTFTRRYGTTPSMMDYARFNYVAQPGDDVAMLPIVSIYDTYSIEWGYTPFPEAASPEDEKRFLEPIVRRQDDNPMLRFGNPSSVDPTQLTEALGDNSVKASEYGMRNLKTIMGYLVDASTTEGEDYSLLNEMYGQVVAQRLRYLNHVAAWVGGVYTHQKRAGQEGPVFIPFDRDRQVEAMRYLVAEGFATPDWLLRPDILALIEPSGVSIRVQASQRSLLNTLIQDARLNRMAELETLYPVRQVYRVTDMLADVRNGVFTELNGRNPRIDLYRRNLQRAYVDIMGARLGSADTSAETRSLIRGNLSDLAARMDAVTSSTTDTATRYHLQDLRLEIRKILDPTAAP